MTHRYFCQERIVPPKATLVGQEATHLGRVMRGSIGDEVVVFDGDGSEYDAVVREVSRHRIDLTITETRWIDRELPTPLTLAVSVPKGDRQKWLVEKAVELGVSTLVPLQTERSVAQPRRAALDKFQRWVIEACKQCGRNRLMRVEEPREWSEFLQDHADSPNRFVAHPTGDASLPMLTQTPNPVYAAVGPEGGFTDEEIAAAASLDWRVISLGRRILRVETAALALAAIVSERMERK